MIETLLIFSGQFFHALLRTAAIYAISREKIWVVMVLNAAANLVRILVLSGGVMAVVNREWVNVAALVIGQAAGDWLAMRLGENLNINKTSKEIP